MNNSSNTRGKKLKWVTLVLFLVPLFFLVRELYEQFHKSRQSSLDGLYQRALETYSRNELDKTLQVIGDVEDQFLDMPEGCDLVVSTLAQSRNFSRLESFSKKCIEKGHSSGIAFEGLAASLTQQKKTDEALHYLNQRLVYGRQERLLTTLANLYLLKKDYKHSRQLFLEVIQNSSIWSTWLSRILKLSPLVSDSDFIRELSKKVFSKSKKYPLVEKKLLKKAEQYKLDDVASRLQERLKGA